MQAKLVDVFSVHSVGTVATLERGDGIAAGDTLLLGSREWTIKEVRTGDPKSRERVALVVDPSAKDVLVAALGGDVEVLRAGNG